MLSQPWPRVQPLVGERRFYKLPKLSGTAKKEKSRNYYFKNIDARCLKLSLLAYVVKFLKPVSRLNSDS